MFSPPEREDQTQLTWNRAADLQKGFPTRVALVVRFVQGILGHALQEQLKDGRSVLLPIMPQDVHRRLTPVVRADS